MIYLLFLLVFVILFIIFDMDINLSPGTIVWVELKGLEKYNSQENSTNENRQKRGRSSFVLRNSWRRFGEIVRNICLVGWKLVKFSKDPNILNALREVENVNLGEETNQVVDENKKEVK